MDVAKLASSNSEARRLIKQGAVKVNGEIVTEVDMEIDSENSDVLIQKGKRGFVRVTKTRGL